MSKIRKLFGAEAIRSDSLSALLYTQKCSTVHFKRPQIDSVKNKIPIQARILACSDFLHTKFGLGILLISLAQATVWSFETHMLRSQIFPNKVVPQVHTYTSTPKSPLEKERNEDNQRNFGLLYTTYTLRGRVDNLFNIFMVMLLQLAYHTINIRRNKSTMRGVEHTQIESVVDKNPSPFCSHCLVIRFDVLLRRVHIYSVF